MAQLTKSCIFGGRCQDCGRCNRLGLDARKERITMLPEGFLQALPKRSGAGLGVAFDIGTTTVVGMLWDLDENRLLGIASRTNPQRTYGQDVISRITHCIEDGDGLSRLHGLIIDCLNEIIAELLPAEHMARLSTVTAVGNTTMCHLLLGVDPRSLARSPFDPAYTGSRELPAGEIGLATGSDALLRVLPGIAGHIGADITAGILAERLDKKLGTWLFVDIGTNGEMVLVSDGALTACSTAAGPAFEGAAIKCGMRASAGAIEKLRVTPDGVEAQTISGAPPAGLCGSGLIDAVAGLLDADVINYKGRMSPPSAAGKLPPALLSLLSESVEGTQFRLSGDVFITQQDIRQVQLGKGAILAGAEILLRDAGKTAAGLDGIIIAGAFGSYIDKHSALRIGLFPQIPAERISGAGNAAGAGASMALLSEAEWRTAAALSQSVRHINLAGRADFEREYVMSMYFPRRAKVSADE